MKQAAQPFPEFRLTSVTTSPFEPRRRSRLFEEDQALAKVRKHLEENLTSRFTLAQAAEIAGFERTYFSSYFHKRVGITFVRWMNALRIAHAIELLRAEELPIIEVAGQVGYADLRTFERNFRRLTGHTPKVFREQARLHREHQKQAQKTGSTQRPAVFGLVDGPDRVRGIGSGSDESSKGSEQSTEPPEEWRHNDEGLSSTS